MRHSSLRRAGATAVAGGLLLAIGSPATFGDNLGGSLQILGLAQSGGLLQLTLANNGRVTLTGNIVVSVSVGGERSLAFVPFTVSGGQKTFVSWASPDRGGRIIDVGIIVDDGAPI